MAIWWNTTDLLDSLELEENSIVSRVIQAVGLFGDILSIEDMETADIFSEEERQDGTGESPDDVERTASGTDMVKSLQEADEEKAEEENQIEDCKDDGEGVKQEEEEDQKPQRNQEAEELEMQEKGKQDEVEKKENIEDDDRKNVEMETDKHQEVRTDKDKESKKDVERLMENIDDKMVERGGDEKIEGVKETAKEEVEEVATEERKVKEDADGGIRKSVRNNQEEEHVEKEETIEIEDTETKRKNKEDVEVKEQEMEVREQGKEVEGDKEERNRERPEEEEVEGKDERKKAGGEEEDEDAGKEIERQEEEEVEKEEEENVLREEEERVKEEARRHKLEHVAEKKETDIMKEPGKEKEKEIEAKRHKKEEKEGERGYEEVKEGNALEKELEEEEVRGKEEERKKDQDAKDVPETEREEKAVMEREKEVEEEGEAEEEKEEEGPEKEKEEKNERETNVETENQAEDPNEVKKAEKEANEDMERKEEEEEVEQGEKAKEEEPNAIPPTQDTQPDLHESSLSSPSSPLLPFHDSEFPKTPVHDSVAKENGDPTTGHQSKVTEAPGILMDQEKTSKAAAKTHIEDVYLTSLSNDNGSKHTLSGGGITDSDPDPNAAPLTHFQTPLPKFQSETNCPPCPNSLNPSNPAEVSVRGSETATEVEKQLGETSTEGGSSTSEKQEASSKEGPSSSGKEDTSTEEEPTSEKQEASAEEGPSTSEKQEVLEAQVLTSFLPPAHQDILETLSSGTTEAAGQTTSEPAAEIKLHLEKDLQASGSTLLDEKVTLMDATAQSVIDVEQRNKDLDPMQNSSNSDSGSKPQGNVTVEVMEEEEETMEGQEEEAGQNSPQMNGEVDNKKNGSRQAGKYKTVSYRRIRKGNTRQRIDEFESMINL